MDLRLSFDHSPEIYDRARPTYPAEVFEHLFGYLGAGLTPSDIAAIEVGPGTGQATRDLMERGARVTAVEIGANLAGFLRRKFEGDDRLTVINSAFEDIDLPAASYDLVFSATAFHWLDPALRVRKSHELLRPNGVLAVVSTIQIQSEVDQGYFDRTTPIYRKWGQASDPPPAPTEDSVMPSEHDEFLASGLLKDVSVWRFRHDQTYTTDAYEDLVRSYSVTEAMSLENREGLIADLKTVSNKEYGGRVVRPLVIALTVGRRA